jgi:hypothetical protein
MIKKTNICSIMQPTYLPWLGYFDLIAQSKDFIFLDNVKFNKSSYHHHNKILGANGEIVLSVPTFVNKGRMNTLINEVTIDYSKKWQKKHLESIRQSYSKSPYFDQVYPDIESIIAIKDLNLCELNIRLIKLFASRFSFDTNFYLASEIANSAQDNVQRLINYCEILQCDNYYSPVGSSYLNKVDNKELFKSAKITVSIQKFKLTPYLQKSKSFTPYMSVVDALMYSGYDETRDVIEKSSHYEELKLN